MIKWLLFLPLFYQRTHAGYEQENGVLHCGPQNLVLTTSEQKLLLTWGDHPSCSSLHVILTYELMVLIADKQIHYDEVVVTANQIGSTHSWNWTSYFPLECASHSVRLSSRYNNNKSPWKEEQTLPGSQGSEDYKVYPRNKVLEVGRIATFCCIVPDGESFVDMYLSGNHGNNMSTTKISNQRYALTVHLNHASDHCVDVKCKTNTTKGDYGACNFILYPPDDRDLQCETRDLESVECNWTKGRNTTIFNGSKTFYHLLGRKCTFEAKGRCYQKIHVEPVEKDWTLTAENSLGKVKLKDSADLTKRVYMFAPEGVTASKLNARNVSLIWMWTVQQYKNLNLTCQVNINNNERNTTIEASGIGLHASVLSNLMPDWTHDVKVRCRTAQHFWKWGDWSKSVNFHTYGDVPDALDVWMHMKENKTIIMWKMTEANRRNGHIIHYKVSWAKTISQHQQNNTNMPHNKQNLTISLETSDENVVTVTAWNLNGSSSPSAIIIPSLKPGKSRVNTSFITGNKRGFNLSWPRNPKASCGYIVDWCPSVEQGTVEWLKLPPNQTTVNITSRNFLYGLRYSLSIYACTQGAPVLLEKREGYIKETRIEDGLFKSLKHKQQDSDVELFWAPIPLREQNAFIHGYSLYYWDNGTKVFIMGTDNPEATSLTAKNLKSRSYTFTMTAQTAVGECGNTNITATLNSQIADEPKNILIPMGAVFGLLLLTIIIYCRHWEYIKQKLYAPVPKPVLLDDWLTSLVVHCSHLHTVQNQQSEDDMDVPQLYNKLGELVTDSQKTIYFTFSQTPKDYNSNPLKKPNPTPPSSTLLRGAFPNPSYDQIVQSENQLSNSESEVQEGTTTQKSSYGYQPQGHTFSLNQTEEDPESSFHCVSTYILLPQ